MTQSSSSSMYKKMYLVPPHVYSNVKKCLKTADERSEMAEANTTITTPDFFAQTLQKEKKPHAPLNRTLNTVDRDKDDERSREKDDADETNGNETGNILSRYNLNATSDADLSKSKGAKGVQALTCHDCGRTYKLKYHFDKHIIKCKNAKKKKKKEANKSQSRRDGEESDMGKFDEDLGNNASYSSQLFSTPKD